MWMHRLMTSHIIFFIVFYVLTKENTCEPYKMDNKFKKEKKKSMNKNIYYKWSVKNYILIIESWIIDRVYFFLEKKKLY